MKQHELLTREGFRAKVLARHNGKCCVPGCPYPAEDAHHIIERRLWADGGYYLANGAALCDRDGKGHHIQAEQTTLSCQELREFSGIEDILLPLHLYREDEYDKWGNRIEPDGSRTPGELYWDASVQAVLRQGGVLHLFRPYVKHPRTHHLPWSPGRTRDDVELADLSGFHDQHGNPLEVVATCKLDGEQASLYSDYYHARSIDGPSHPSRDWVKGLWATICADIPPGWRVCGENMYAKHSIKYTDLDSYFYVHSVWNERNVCLSWNETLEWCNLLNLEVVPLLYQGPFDATKIQRLWTPAMMETREGYVVRLTAAFPFSEHRLRVAKFVRPSHVQTTHHWKYQKIERNLLKNRQERTQ